MAYYPRLRDMREDHDLTQQKLAKYLGMPQPQYFRYEQGLRDIPTDILIQLAKLYNTTTDYLLGLTDNPVIPWRQGGASRTPPLRICGNTNKKPTPGNWRVDDKHRPLTSYRESAVYFLGFTPSVP